MNGNYERDELEFDDSDCQSSFNINVGVCSEEHAMKRLTSATRRVSDKIDMMSMLYQRNVGKLRDPYKLCKKRKSYNYRSEWYQRSKRSIPFQVLETSATDAVLALDRSGSYMFAVGDGRKSYSVLREISSKDLTLFPAISLRLYAVPSRASLEQSQWQCGHRHGDRCPHVMTIPLMFQKEDDDDSEEIYNSATTPIQFLASDDFSVGVAFVHHSKRIEDGASGSVVIFPLPAGIGNNVPRTIKSYRLPNSIIGGIHSHTLRNLLWKTRIMPIKSNYCKDDGTLICDVVVECNGYVFLNDEEDGFRIFWLSTSAADFDEQNELDPLQPCQQKTVPKRNDIVNLVDSSAEAFYTDSENESSHSLPPCQDDIDQITIVSEGYLRIDALLSDILRRKKKMIYGSTGSQISQVLPDYYYNLISIEQSRSAKLAIVFKNPLFSRLSSSLASPSKRQRVPASFAVFLTIDLFDQSYTETKWFQNADSNNLQNWGNQLATHHQMSVMQVGPYCVPTFTETVGAKRRLKTHERNEDDEDESNFEKWKLFVNQNRLKAPKDIGMSSLYPSCDVITNGAVTTNTPVHKISCRYFPLELAYETRQSS